MLDFLQHLVHGDHGEQAVVAGLLAAAGPARLRLTALLHRRYRVVHEMPSLLTSTVEVAEHGPYRLRSSAVLVAFWVRGPWDRTTIEEVS